MKVWFWPIERQCYAEHCTFGGRRFTIEIPDGSLLFLSSPMVWLSSFVPITSVCFDQCMYGLRPPSAGVNDYVRKRTKVWGNSEQVQTLGRHCAGKTKEHNHVYALGRPKAVRGAPPQPSRSQAAGHYPVALCEAFARAITAAISHANTASTSTCNSTSSLASPSGRAKVGQREASGLLG